MDPPPTASSLGDPSKPLTPCVSVFSSTQWRQIQNLPHRAAEGYNDTKSTDVTPAWHSVTALRSPYHQLAAATSQHIPRPSPGPSPDHEVLSPMLLPPGCTLTAPSPSQPLRSSHSQYLPNTTGGTLCWGDTQRARRSLLDSKTDTLGVAACPRSQTPTEHFVSIKTTVKHQAPSTDTPHEVYAGATTLGKQQKNAFHLHLPFA